MKRLMHSALIMVTALSMTLPSNSGNAQPFKAGEKIVVMGDSITHNGLYHAFVYLFYQTRYPDTKVHFINSGVSGGRSTDGAARLAEDVLARDPDVVMINLGMNDVGTSQYTDEDQEAAAETTKRFIERYETKMREIVSGIKAHDSDIRIILVSPSPYDQTGTQERESAVGKNDSIARVTDFLGELAKETGAEVVDFHTPMTLLNIEGQAKDPNFTIVSQDRVHPGPVGHTIMAYYILKGQGVEGTVSDVALSVSGDSAELKSASRAEVSNLSMKDGGLSFELQADALPYPVEDAVRKASDPPARAALDLIPFQDELNREILKIEGLTEERYQLSIEGTPVGIYSADELASGINLAGNELTSQYQQAHKVALLNDRRWDMERPLRGPAWVKYKVAWEGDVDISDEEAVAEYIQLWRDGGAHRDYRAAYDRHYLEFKHPAAYADQEAKIAELVEQVYSENQPQKLSYELIPTKLEALEAPEKQDDTNQGLDSFVTLLEFEEVRSWDGLELDSKNVKSGDFAGLWADTVATDRIRCREFPTDVSAFNAMRVWVHSEKATGAMFAVVFRSEDNSTEGPDYEMAKVTVNWTGWKQVEVPFSSLRTVREPRGMAHITEFLMASSGYGCGDPDPETRLTFDDMEFFTLE